MKLKEWALKLEKPCPKGGLHEGERRVYLCLECQECSFCCPICLHEEHFNHAMLPVKILLAEILGFSQSLESQRELLEYAISIEQSRNKCLQQLKGENKVLQEHVAKYFKKIENCILENCQISKHFLELRYETDPMPNHQLLRLYLQNRSIIRSAMSPTTGFKHKLQKLSKILVCKDEIKIHLLDRIFREVSTPLFLDFYISEHASCIEVEGQQHATKNYLYKYSFCLLDPPISIFDAGKRSLGLKIITCSDIMIGMCDKNSLKHTDYVLDNKDFNQDSIMSAPVAVVTNYGYSFIQGCNSEFVGVSFTNNATIYLIHNSESDKLTVMNGQIFTELKLPSIEDADWHFLVLLIGAHNSIKLINEIPKQILAKS